MDLANFLDFPDFNGLPRVINGPTDILILDRTKSDRPSTRPLNQLLIILHVTYTCENNAISTETLTFALRNMIT